MTAILLILGLLTLAALFTIGYWTGESQREDKDASELSNAHHEVAMALHKLRLAEAKLHEKELYIRRLEEA